MKVPIARARPVLGLLTAAVAACVTPPAADREIELPATYEGSSSGEQTAAALDWQSIFGDGSLVRLIDEALRYNFDRSVALQRIAMARAGAHLNTGRLLPTLSAGTGAGLRRFGRYTMDGAGNASTEIVPGQLVPEHLPDVLIGLESSWELDIWGRLWNQRQASMARLLATEEVAHLIESNLVAEVGGGWFSLIALDESAAVLEATLKRQSDALELVRALRQSGRTSALAVRQFEAELKENQARLIDIQREIANRERALNLLVGRVPQAIERAARSTAAGTGALPSGIPSDLLRFRPDVRFAELQVRAAGFDVRSATAAFLPRVDLGAAVGVQAFNPVYFATPQSVFYSLAGGVLAPLVNRAEIEADFQVATAAQLESLAVYQKTLLGAYVEASDARTNVEAADEMMALKQEQLRLRRQAVQTAELLFTAGKAGWLEVLFAQTEMATAELEVIEGWRQQQQARISLYRALGGGWSTQPSTPKVDDFPFQSVIASEEAPSSGSG